MDKNVNPQAENGHIDIANTIAEKFCRFRLSGNEWQILWVVLRKTYGWHKKEDKISLSQFVKATELLRPNAIRAIKSLVSKKILLVSKLIPQGINSYIFNKHFNEWQGSIKIDTPSIKIDNRVVSKLIHTKETITKEIKHMSISFDFESLWKLYPRPIGKKLAMKHFKASVKNEQDYQNIQQALNNYLHSKTVLVGDEQYIQHGSTWFNNWRDWIVNNTQQQKQNENLLNPVQGANTP